MSNLVKQSLIHAKELGCKVAISEVTGPASQHIMINKLGFKVQKYYPYDDMKGVLSVLNGCIKSDKIAMVYKDL